MVETSRSPSEYWQEVPSFYRELIDRYGWNQTPMLELVELLGRSSWADSIYPSTSHEALGLSKHERYEERLRAPMVYVQYNVQASLRSGQGAGVG